jgi:hypothetical protein
VVVLPRHGTRFLLVRLAAVAARMPCAGDIDMAVTVHGDMGMCRLATAVCRVAWRGPRGVSAWHVRCVSLCCRRDARCAPAAPPLIGPAPPPRPLDRRGPPRPRTPKGVRNARTSFLKGQYGKTQSQTANRSEAANTVALHASYAWGRAPSPGRYAASWRCLLTYLLTERSSGSSKHLAIDRYLTFKRGLSH